MIFEPYNDEFDIIQQIHQYSQVDYALIRLTSTMIDKNNIDANVLLRDLLLQNELVNYNLLDNGGANGVKHEALFLSGNSYKKITMNFYKVRNLRSDPRFSIWGIKNFNTTGILNEHDLLYITVHQGNIIIINTTSNTPSVTLLQEIFGHNELNEAIQRLIHEIRKISLKGPHKNITGKCKISPKDVGDTLENLLGIKTNNSNSADFEGLIEIKSKSRRTLDTLFTLRPQFDGTEIENIEPKDSSRVSAFTRKYGYISEAHPNSMTLYVTIGTKIAPQNQVGLYLEVNEELRRVEIRRHISKSQNICVAHWSFNSLKEALHIKHPATLWVNASTEVRFDAAYFTYKSAILTREPQFATFLSLIKSGGITYDWRGYTSTFGKYKGKNHGNAWRIKSRYKKDLFATSEEIQLQ